MNKFKTYKYIITSIGNHANNEGLVILKRIDIKNDPNIYHIIIPERLLYKSYSSTLGFLTKFGLIFNGYELHLKEKLEYIIYRIENITIYSIRPDPKIRLELFTSNSNIYTLKLHKVQEFEHYVLLEDRFHNEILIIKNDPTITGTLALETEYGQYNVQVGECFNCKMSEVTQIKNTNGILAVNISIENIQFLNSIGFVGVNKI